MDVKFITTTRTLVDTVPIADGQVVACKDHSDLFYDMNQTRYRVGSCMWEPVVSDNVTTGFTLNDATVSVIQFVPNGGSDVVLQNNSPVNFVIGTAGQVVEFTTMPVTEKEGFEFTGWYEDQTTQRQKVDVFPSKYPMGKKVYYSWWKKKQ